MQSNVFRDLAPEIFKFLMNDHASMYTFLNMYPNLWPVLITEEWYVMTPRGIIIDLFLKQRITEINRDYIISFARNGRIKFIWHPKRFFTGRFMVSYKETQMTCPGWIAHIDYTNTIFYSINYDSEIVFGPSVLLSFTRDIIVRINCSISEVTENEVTKNEVIENEVAKNEVIESTLGPVMTPLMMTTEIIYAKVPELDYIFLLMTILANKGRYSQDIRVNFSRDHVASIIKKDKSKVSIANTLLTLR